MKSNIIVNQNVLFRTCPVGCAHYKKKWRASTKPIGVMFVLAVALKFKTNEQTETEPPKAVVLQVNSLSREYMLPD